MVTNGQVGVIRVFSKSLIGSNLSWSAREKECYGVKLFGQQIFHPEDKNLTYINVTFTGEVLRWKLYLQDKDFDLFHVHQIALDALNTRQKTMTGVQSLDLG